MILIFDLFETLVEDVWLDFNLALKPFWEEHYKDRCSFEEIKAYGEELFLHMRELHKQGLEFPFVKDELPMYAKKFGGDVVQMSVQEEAKFLMTSNKVQVYDGLCEMLDVFEKNDVHMYVLSNSGYSAGALRIMLDENGIGRYFDRVWSSADFGKVKPVKEYFDMAVDEILNKFPDCTREDILFVGDNYNTDITGAHNAGLKAAWINYKGEADVNGYATYQIKHVTELRQLITL